MRGNRTVRAGWTGLLLAAACGGEAQPEVEAKVAPTLAVDSPAAADWLAPGPVTVRGSQKYLVDLRVDGETVEPLAENWEKRLVLEPGIHVFEAVGTGPDGDAVTVRRGVLAGDFAEPEGPVAEAMRIRLNRGGLADVLELAGGLLDAEAMAAAAAELNPVYEDSYGIWGWDAVTISADLTALDFGAPVLSASPTDGRLEVVVVLPDLHVDVEATGEVVGSAFDTAVSMDATRAVVTVGLGAGAVDGRLDVELLDADLALEGFSYDTSLLPGDVEDWLLVDTVREKVESMVLEQVRATVPALLDEKLAELDPSFQAEVLGVPVAVSADFAEVAIDGEGLDLALDLAVDIPPAGTRTWAGVFTTGAAATEPSNATDLALSISDDFLNRVLFEAWRGGLLDLELSTADGSLDPLLLGALGASEGSIGVSAELPPVIVDADGAMQLQLGELQVAVDTPDGDLGQRLDLAVAAWADLGLVYASGELGLDLGAVRTSLDVRGSDWGASNEATTKLVSEMLPLDAMLALVGAFRFPVPELGGLRVADAAIDRASGATEVALDLEPATD